MRRDVLEYLAEEGMVEYDEVVRIVRRFDKNPEKVTQEARMAGSVDEPVA